MNIKRAKEEIKHTIEAYLKKNERGEYCIPRIRQRPVLLMGPPGIGKTQIMEQIAGECDLALVAYTITHHTRQSAIGLPFIREKEYGGQKRSVTEYTMSEIIASVYDRMEESGKQEGILFIDEINCVSETLAPTMLQFLQGKTFGNQAVPDGWIIVAAGNPPEYNRSVREFDVVTLDRVKEMEIEADFDIWKEYAYAEGVHGSIISYLDIHKENFYRMETTVDGKQFVTARGWQDLSELIVVYEELGLLVDREVVSQYIRHPAVAKDFANYLELYYKYRTDYQVDEILQGTIRPGTLNKLKFAPFDERLKVVGLLLARLSENFRRAYELDEYTAKLFDCLKTLRGRLEVGQEPDEESPSRIAGELADAGREESPSRIAGELADAGREESPSRIVRQLADAGREDMERRIRAGQNERRLRSSFGKVYETLDRYAGLITDCDGDGPAAFERLRAAFLKERETLEEVVSKASAQLEYAFDFMEAAFGESQEMVVFITELSVNRYAVWFLGENDCDRYYMYNKSLLFADQEADVRAQLDEIRNLQIT